MSDIGEYSGEINLAFVEDLYAEYLRDPESVSFEWRGNCDRFRRILGDPVPDPAAVRRVLGCGGKVYCDIRKALAGNTTQDLAVVRLEQLHPLSAEPLREALSPYVGAEACWVQDEPLNRGGWRYLQMRFPGVFSRVISRPESATPATGSMGSHKREQRELIELALAVE